jgi:hypothetical protein
MQPRMTCQDSAGGRPASARYTQFILSSVYVSGVDPGKFVHGYFSLSSSYAKLFFSCGITNVAPARSSDRYGNFSWWRIDVGDLDF